MKACLSTYKVPRCYAFNFLLVCHKIPGQPRRLPTAVDCKWACIINLRNFGLEVARSSVLDRLGRGRRRIHARSAAPASVRPENSSKAVAHARRHGPLLLPLFPFLLLLRRQGSLLPLLLSVLRSTGCTSMDDASCESSSWICGATNFTNDGSTSIWIYTS
jgi:hypothetical protein